MARPLDLVADIGGTNARFALVDPSAAVPELLHPRTLAGAGFASLQQAARHYLGSVDARPSRAAFAVAAPVSGDAIHLTNRAWSTSAEALRGALGLEELQLLNDFGAVAWAVTALRAEDRVDLHGRAGTVPAGPISVLGPGTGLGVGLLVGSPREGWRVIETEGGHASFAPLDQEEARFSAWLAARHGRASNERVLCGEGLSQLDAFLRGGDALHGAPREPSEIVAAALDGTDEAARRALERFCAMLGSVAGDYALIHGARTVAIAGGMVPRFIPFLRASGFRERFLAKGRFAAWLEPVAIQVVTHPHPGLLGAAVALRAQ